MERKEGTAVSSTPRIVLKGNFLQRYKWFLETFVGGSPGTRKKYIRIIKVLAGRKRELTQEHLAKFLMKKNRRYVGSAIKIFLKMLSKEGALPREDLNIILEDLPKIKERDPRPRVIPEYEEFRKIMDLQNEENGMIMKFLMMTGLRCHEVFSIVVNDIDFEKGIIVVKTKGGKFRPVKIPGSFREELRKYVIEDKGLLGTERIFYTNSQGTPETKMKYYWRVLNKASHKAIGKGIGTHDLRRFFGSYLLEKTGDVELVNRLMNHSKIDTTLRYTQFARREADLKRAEDVLEEL